LPLFAVVRGIEIGFDKQLMHHLVHQHAAIGDELGASAGIS
jgi:hypothetical protein